MPINVVCPGCGARLNAPDSAAGKRVKCPRPGCGSLIEVAALTPAFEVVEDAPAPARKKAVARELDDEDEAPKKPARGAAEDEDGEERRARKKKRRDEDEDEDEDDRPTRKRKKAKKSGGAFPLVVAGVVLVALLVAGGVGYGVYALALKKNDDTAGTGGGGTGGGGIGGLFRAPVPAGWVEHTSERDKFKAYFPKKPEVHANLSLDKFKGARPKSVNGYAIGSPSDDLMVMLSVAELNPGTSQADRDALADGFNKTWRAGVGSQEGTATWAGRPAKQFVIEKKNPKGPSSGAVVRQMSTDTHMYGVVIVSKTWPVPPAVLDGFFDNFELLD
jgi:hypothetical protein